jgi:predicted PurR-regulated permease PerM
MNICINKEMENMNKDIQDVMKKVLEDLECNLDQQKFTAIKDMVNSYFGIGVATAAFLGGGVAVGFGVGSVSSALIAINAGVAASIGVPVIGIIAGSIALLGGGIYLNIRSPPPLFLEKIT